MKAISLIIFLQLLATGLFAGTAQTAWPTGVAVSAVHSYERQMGRIAKKAERSKARAQKPAKAKGDGWLSFLFYAFVLTALLGFFAVILGILLKLAMVSWMTWGIIWLSLGVTVFFALVAFAIFIIAYTNQGMQ